MPYMIRISIERLSCVTLRLSNILFIKPGIEEVQKAMGILEDSSLYSKFGEAVMRSFKELNFNVEKEYVFNKKQTLISDFFLKQKMVMLSMYICCIFDVFLLPYRLKLR